MGEAGAVDETGRYTLMYVDDDAQTLRLFRRYFSDKYQVFTATTGQEALVTLSRGSVNVLFADQRMPGMSGIQLLETVAREFPDTARVLVTGYSDIDVVIDAINRGAVFRYLSKPWDFEELASIIGNALEVHSLKSHNQKLIDSLDEQNRLLLRTVEELRFLNQLDLELKAIREVDLVLRRTIDRLKEELGAEDGWYWERGTDTWNVRIPPRKPGCAETLPAKVEHSALEPLGEATVFALTESTSVCVLPLSFAEIRFGALALEFDGLDPLDSSELLFIQAVSHVASSVLYSHHVHTEEIKREQLMMIGQMSSMIVHDLKGPLAIILGFVALLQADIPAEQRAEFGAIINQEVTRLIEMVEELLSFSKGQPRLQISSVDLRALVEEILELFRLSFEKEGIVVELEVATDHIVSGDRGKLKKVLINLLQNARDHLRDLPGERRIRIHCARDEHCINVGVANSGPALPSELLPRIFDPFYSYKKDEGTGLGLTICKKIVEEHGGTLSVRRDKEFTEFVICLPRESGTNPEEKNRSLEP
jgi:signal transduction histidine kinase/FixJ family two-component response regulator